MSKCGHLSTYLRDIWYFILLLWILSSGPFLWRVFVVVLFVCFPPRFQGILDLLEGLDPYNFFFFASIFPFFIYFWNNFWCCLPSFTMLKLWIVQLKFSCIQVIKNSPIPSTTLYGLIFYILSVDLRGVCPVHRISYDFSFILLSPNDHLLLPTSIT